MRNDIEPAGSDDQVSTDRRNFIRFLAASPLMTPAAVSSMVGALTAASGAAVAQSYDVLRAPMKQIGDVIDAPEQALDVFDFEPAAKKALPPAHYGYLASGVDGDATLRANQDAFSC